jgi:hypothetical protein
MKNARLGLMVFILTILTSALGAAQQTSTLCHFEKGPRAGQTQDYAPQAPLPVGTPCQDGQQPLSTGHVVADGGQTSTLCHFEKGPRAGQTQDYAPQAPLPVGTPCQDGQQPLSSGHVVASGNGGGGNAGGGGGQTSTLCHFEKGPRAGQTQDYAPQAPLPVGTPCQDGQQPLSSGHVVAHK